MVCCCLLVRPFIGFLICLFVVRLCVCLCVCCVCVCVCLFECVIVCARSLGPRLSLVQVPCARPLGHCPTSSGT